MTKHWIRPESQSTREPPRGDLCILYNAWQRLMPSQASTDNLIDVLIQLWMRSRGGYTVGIAGIEPVP